MKGFMNCFRLAGFPALIIFFLFSATPANGQIDTAVFGAIKKCDINTLQQKIKTGTDLNATDSNGANALMWAVYYCDLQVVRFLVQQGARLPQQAVIHFEDENMPEVFYGNVQSVAADKGKLTLLQYLIDSLHLSSTEKGYNPVSRENDDFAPLYWAMFREHMDIISYLLSKNKEQLGDRSEAFINEANRLAKESAGTNKVSRGHAVHQYLTDLAKAYFGEDHANYARALFNYGTFYFGIGQFEKAIPLFEKGVEIFKRQEGSGHRHYTMYLNNLAYLYGVTDKNQKAINILEEAAEIVKKRLGDQNVTYSLFLLGLGNEYRDLGEYDKALSLIQRAVMINKKVVGDKHVEYVTALNILANLYSLIGGLDNDVSIREQLVQLYKEIHGEKHIQYAHALANLAYAFLSTKNYDKAVTAYEATKAKYSEVAGEEHPEYAKTLRYLGMSYFKKGELDTAVKLVQRAGEIYSKSAGENSTNYASSLLSLGTIYASAGQCDKAIPVYEKAIKIYHAILGENYATIIPYMNELALCYAGMGNINVALNTLIRSSRLQQNMINRTYSTLSEYEKMKLISSTGMSLHYLPSILLNNGNNQLALSQLYRNELLFKSIVLQSQQAVISSIRNSKDSTALKLYEEWRAGRSMIAKQLLLPIKNRVPFLDSLEQVNNQQEQNLSKLSAAFKTLQQSQAISVMDVAQRLSKGEAAVEFINFKVMSNKNRDSVMYAALLLLPHDTVPRFVPLFEEKQLQQILKSIPGNLRSTSYEAVQKLYDRSSGTSKRPSLYDLIWKPFEKYLLGVTKVYYAPAGLLHKISFAALPVTSNQVLIDKYQLNQVLSTRSVAAPADQGKVTSASIWGNIQYDIDRDSDLAGRGKTRGDEGTGTTPSNFNLLANDTRSIRGPGWKSLPATRLEADSVRKQLVIKNITTTTFSGVHATEEAFKKLSGNSPGVLHLATHGFFLPVIKKDPDVTSPVVFSVQQNPMLRSGLILAGGNKTWKGEMVNTKEDGILTAFEIAQMDLGNTQLAVLSACETALGDLQGSEGVIGLQRALKMAGVKQMIVSLWQVPDKPTMQLMNAFYKNWLGGLTTREALRKAQLQLKKKYPSPYFWAAFVLVE